MQGFRPSCYEGLQQNIWVTVIRDLINFTISSPVFFLPGLCLLLDLLPRPGPFIVLNSPSFDFDPISSRGLDKSGSATVVDCSQQRWAVCLLCLRTEVCGLIELLAGSCGDCIRSGYLDYSPSTVAGYPRDTNLRFCNAFDSPISSKIDNDNLTQTENSLLSRLLFAFVHRVADLAPECAQMLAETSLDILLQVQNLK
ncbi:unnamed protein product [Protopolystoma xenopodis]|uniref:Uncharacterized protein n=1 Tax=Protopolystoma xenopodis TaxID=117903 RepID=A0A3S5BRQ6_9PLAT|nr:unnamed protein product [Protopolystoma xenopodis]